MRSKIDIIFAYYLSIFVNFILIKRNYDLAKTFALPIKVIQLSFKAISYLYSEFEV